MVGRELVTPQEEFIYLMRDRDIRLKLVTVYYCLLSNLRFISAKMDGSVLLATVRT